MNKKPPFLLTILFLVVASHLHAQTPAFPGAEGAGMYTAGGRGGKVLYVTSLDDDNEPGTLRWAIDQKGPRTILFNVSGLIELKSPLKIRNGDLTIAGQSAPGDGICISNYETSIHADNVIVRFLRFRLGDKMKQPVDAFSGNRCKNIIIDHCSMSWSLDEVSSFYGNENFTLQWCFITESLRNSAHLKGRHGYGGIWGGQNATFHHNLFAHNDSRNPRFCGSRYTNQPELEKVDYRNNVIYNWGMNSAYAAEGGSYNIVNNYYKPGPATSKSSKNRIINPDADNGENSQPAGIYGKFFVAGNHMEGSPEVTADNLKGIKMGDSFKKFAPNVKLDDILAKDEFPVMPVVTDDAQGAYEKVLEYGGSSLIRDDHDIRIIENVKNNTYSFKGSAGSTNGLIDSQEDVGGWQEYKTYNEVTDSNADGIPDAWLEKNYPGKNANDLDEEGYTLLEVYLNSLVAHLMVNAEIGKKPVKRFVVDKSGKGDFKTIQEAVNAVRAFDPDWETEIFIEEGTYYEKIVIPDYLCGVKIIGRNRDKTIISNNDHANINNMGTFKTYTLQIRGSAITLENLTIENNAPQVGQAVALHTEGDEIIVRNCNLLGNQDTVYTGGKGRKLYFQDCHIEGTTDFIFGPATAWFENCRLLGKKNSYITAASTPEDVPFGYVFNRCEITVADGVSSLYLGRPWRAHAMTLFMDCELPKEINPLGWHNWGKTANEKTVRYCEHNNSGAGSDTSQRVQWMKKLDENEARQITLENVMGDFYKLIANKI